MSFVNTRDVRLQAASPRVVPLPIDPGLIPGLPETIAATKGIKLTATGNVFQISAGGVATPASITITATVTLVSGAVVWDIYSGTATLTGSGNTRTLTAANMASSSVTIRARVQEAGGPVYTDYWTIAKTADGQNGTDGTSGADGQRGSITAFGTLSNLVAYPDRPSGRARWAAGSQTEGSAIAADTAARNVIWQRLGNGGSAPNNNHLRLGDTVTLTNSAQNVSATGYWTGAAWDSPGTVIDGNLLVGGNVAGQEFTGGVFTGGLYRTAAQGSRAVLESVGGNAHSLTFYLGLNEQYTMRLSSEGKSVMRGSFADYVLTGENLQGGVGGGGLKGYSSSNGNGLWGESNTGYGVVGKANGAGGVAGRFISASGAAVQMAPIGSLPVDRTAGSFCVFGGKPHFADGAHWYELTLGAQKT